MKRIGFALLIGLLILTGCTPKSEQNAQTTCSQVIVTPVFSLHGDLITTFVSGELKSHYEYDPNDGYFYRTADNIEEWTAYYEKINAGVRKANTQLARIYADGGLIYGESLFEYTMNDEHRLSYGDSEPGSCPESDDPKRTDWDWDEGIRLNFRWSCNDDDRTKRYCTDTTFAGETVYVTVTTPGGSRVDYSYPTEWLDQIMWSSFGDQEAMDFSPQFVAPDVLLDEQSYTESLLRTLVGDGSSREIASFTLVVSDFQGRNELRPVIARAMEIAAVQAGHPVAMTLRGMLSNGQYTVANISAHQNEFNIEGWMMLGFGGMSGSGGGGTLESSYVSYYEDLTRGSIFIVNP